VLCIDLLMPVLDGNILSFCESLLDLLGELVEIHESFTLLYARPSFPTNGEENEKM
jgi:hypothetical protein